MIRCFTISLLLLACTANAANRYVRAGATGAADGANWTDAYTQLPTTLVRGDTYYIAGGTYPGYTFNTAASGTSLITVKKAVVADHGTETGWLDVYAQQTVFTGYFNILRSWFLLDGQVRNESDWFSGAAYGIKIQHNNNWTHMSIQNGSTWNTNITTQYVYIAAQIGVLPPNGGQISPDAITTKNNDNAIQNPNITFRRVFVEGSNQSFLIRQTKGCIIEYCATDRTCGQDGTGWHGENVNAFYLYDGGPIVRYCHFRNSYNGASGYPAGGGTGVIAIADVDNGTEIYGNIFENYYVGDGAIAAGWPNQGIKVYNNTFVNGVQGSGALVRFPQSGSANGNVAYNNIAVNCSNPTYNGLGTAFNHSTLPTSALVNHAGRNYKLAAATAAGTSFPSPYNTDLTGVTRGADGVWDRGAYEFVSGSGVGDTNIPTVTLSAPTNNSVLSNTVSMTASASDDTAVSGVEFFLGNTLLSDDTASAYAYSWDTTAHANGVYTVRVRARDAAGNFGYSATNTVSISNTVTLPDPTVYFNFSENTGTTSTDTIAANVATFVGNTAWTPGRFGTGVALDGTGDYLTAPNSASLNIGDTSFSVASWVKLTNQSTWQQIVAKVEGEAGGFTTPFFSWHLFGGHSGTTNWIPMWQVVNSTPTSVNVSSSIVVNYGDWVHVVGTYDGANIKIYVNGVLRGTAAQTGNVIQYTQPLYIGADGTPGEVAEGVIDELRVYDVTLTAAQVLALYEFTPSETVAPTVVTPPSDLRLIYSASSNLTVVASGTAPLHYQWRKNTTNNVGSNQAFYTITGGDAAGNYDVVITNSTGSVTSSVAIVEIVFPPAVAVVGVTRTNLYVGSTLLVETTQSNTPLFTVWYRGDTVVSMNTNVLEKRLGVSDTGTYSVVVTNEAGDAFTTSFYVYVYQSSNTTTPLAIAGSLLKE